MGRVGVCRVCWRLPHVLRKTRNIKHRAFNETHKCLLVDVLESWLVISRTFVITARALAKQFTRVPIQGANGAGDRADNKINYSIRIQEKSLFIPKLLTDEEVYFPLNDWANKQNARAVGLQNPRAIHHGLAQ